MLIAGWWLSINLECVIRCMIANAMFLWDFNVSIDSLKLQGHSDGTYGILVEKANITMALRLLDMREPWKPTIGMIMITVSVKTSPAPSTFSHGT
jgi:hypothetical protein